MHPVIGKRSGKYSIAQKLSCIYIFRRTDWDQWIMMALIGFSVGFIAFLLHQIIEWLTDVRIETTREYLAVSRFTP